jgi:hypothetical protein
VRLVSPLANECGRFIAPCTAYETFSSAPKTGCLAPSFTRRSKLVDRPRSECRALLDRHGHSAHRLKLGGAEARSGRQPPKESSSSPFEPSSLTAGSRSWTSSVRALPLRLDQQNSAIADQEGSIEFVLVTQPNCAADGCAVRDDH